MPVAGPIAPTRRALIELLAEARARTLLIVSPLTAAQIATPVSPELDSVLSQLQRITEFEAGWLLNETPDRKFASYDEWFDWMMDLRQRVLDRLDSADLTGGSPDAERCRLVLEHEYRTGETILEATLLLSEPYTPPERRRLPRGRRLADPGFMVRFPGGIVEIGGGALSLWPEEWPTLEVTLPPFWIDALPVTNGDFVTFMAAGGYSERDHWSDEGWHWMKTSGSQMPEYWSWQEGVWWIRGAGGEVPLDLSRPVSHVSCYEAEAFARFVGKRLPTELEWEAAASWDPETQSRRRFPWGNMAPSPHVANLEQLAFGPAPVGAFPGNLSPIGCYGMIGDLWEWTASSFLPYSSNVPDSPLPLGRYGAEYAVLRGGSWATRIGAIRSTVRRGALRGNRTMFCGFRCAKDARP